jgi:hypothetical protein
LIVIARVFFPKQSPYREGDCFVGKIALLAMTELIFARALSSAVP